MGSSAVQLDLSEWLPWQNMLQQTSLFGHGKRSVNLVDLLEFTDLQREQRSAYGFLFMFMYTGNYLWLLHLSVNMGWVFRLYVCFHVSAVNVNCNVLRIQCFIFCWT